ncbi:hypothetical protein FOZ63_033392 [Perkinsus olseni]|uniref:Fcf2 pre-rRNA processing C-terminal domain-containing protein n=2 Tax=Perkinsus olseni TaxID=32597 RepID=A0A7J6ULG0_PEROL|nr:hypothetical protein FOZ63_033392 [Perkinsus olseni]
MSTTLRVDSDDEDDDFVMRFVSDRLKAKARAEDSSKKPRPGVVKSCEETGNEFFNGLDLAKASTRQPPRTFASSDHTNESTAITLAGLNTKAKAGDWNVDPEEVIGDNATKPLPSRDPLALNSAAPDVVQAVAERKGAKREKDQRLDGWFGLPRQQLTLQMKNELRILKLKPYMDPKKFMKRLDSKKLPTHFHVGVEVGGGKVRAGGGAESQAAGTYNKTSRGSGVSLLSDALKDSTVQAWTRRRLSEAQTLAKLRAPYKVKRKSKAAKNSWKKRR